ncbi:protein misato homolog 1-like isoform X2 [Homarus americanus]|uniref:protein misato homolog 1-like isoform X2 n=1 Tax=Homarus americanus TaxID=6706 RepID=UPI001C47281D|nr:protein misato homolog 1-like isoform X2 [Homarus americanus]
MAQNIRELITLQIGHHANFVGTHWWNLQEASFVYNSSSTSDINHDFLFREGVTSQRQETYTPRLLCIDTKGSLHSLPAHGSLYNPIQPDHSTSEASWDGPVELIQQLPEEKNEYLMDLEQEDARFLGPADEDKDICIDDSSISNKVPDFHLAPSQKIYDLTKSVKVWSDFLRPHFHPTSIYLLDDTLVKSARTSGNTDETIWGFPLGSALFQREEVEDEITDRIRRLAESCNSLQGFQILSDIHDGMGGVCYGVLQHLADEYGSKDSITFATTPSQLSPVIPQARILTRAAIVQENNPYITSSVMAAFVDTASLVYRSRTSPLPLSYVVDMLSPGGRNVAAGSVALPLGLRFDQAMLEWLQQGHKPNLVSLSAGCDYTVAPISEIRVIRGVPSSRLVRPDTKLPPGVHYTTASQLYNEFLQESHTPPSMRMVTGVQDPLKLNPPFPSIFSGTFTEDGYANNVATTNIKSAPCAAGLHQGAGIGHLLQHLVTAAEKLDVTKVPSLVEEGLDKDGWSGVVEDLRNITRNYCINNIEIDSSDND